MLHGMIMLVLIEDDCNGVQWCPRQYQASWYIWFQHSRPHLFFYSAIRYGLGYQPIKSRNDANSTQLWRKSVELVLLRQSLSDSRIRFVTYTHSTLACNLNQLT